MSASGIDPRTFRQTCSKFATGVTVVTLVGTDGLPHGMTVNSFTSVSAVPPLVLVCVDHSSNLIWHFRAATHYCVNVLSNGQQELSNRFATRGTDRFEGQSWDRGETGVPLIPDSLAHMECEIRNSVIAGDHDILIAEVLHIQMSDGAPLVFFDGGYKELA